MELLERSLEELISAFIDMGTKSYKKIYASDPMSSKLTRHEPVVIDGHEFSYWREFSTYKMAQYLSDKFPGLKTDVYLDGNDSILEIEDCEDIILDVKKHIVDFFKENQLEKYLD